MLLGTASTKTVKGEKLGFYTAILYLRPANESGLFNANGICPFASAGCKATCLETAGRGVFSAVRNGRQRKTEYFAADRGAFIAELHRDIERHERAAKRRGLIPVVRLNGTSDIAWHKIAPALFTAHPTVQFYDYTKSPNAVASLATLPANYHVTFSRSETNSADVAVALMRGMNVAVVVDNKLTFADAVALIQSLPEFRNAERFVNGDDHDLRFLDGYQSAVVILTAKGKAKKDTSGFVIRRSL
jgi:hypothetical protein